MNDLSAILGDKKFFFSNNLFKYLIDIRFFFKAQNQDVNEAALRTSIRTTPHKKIDEENKILKKCEENSMKSSSKGSNDDVLDLTKTIGENEDFNDINEEDQRFESLNLYNQLILL